MGQLKNAQVFHLQFFHGGQLIQQGVESVAQSVSTQIRLIIHNRDQWLYRMVKRILNLWRCSMRFILVSLTNLLIRVNNMKPNIKDYLNKKLNEICYNNNRSTYLSCGTGGGGVVLSLLITQSSNCRHFSQANATMKVAATIAMTICPFAEILGPFGI